jgi:hypothetical protein
MQYVIGGIVSLVVIALAIGAVTGRVRARSCCAPADPALDARMRAAGVGPSVPATGDRDGQG